MTAMESTGSYWKPIYNILEAENVPVIIANAHIGGESDPKKLANFAKGSLRKKQDILGRSLTGLINDHLRNILFLMRRHVRCLDELIETTDLQIYSYLTAENDILERLMTIPGVGQKSAEVLFLR